MRQLGSFLPGEGVGGAGVHWNGVTWRWLPWDQGAAPSTPSPVTAGAAIPTDMNPQDWGVSYDEVEPYYDKFEFLCGISGKAGNLRGQKIGAAMFSRTAAAGLPNPPMIQSTRRPFVREAAENPRLSPFPRTFSQRIAALRQSRRRGLWGLPLLRLLRALRLRGERQGEPAFHGHPACGQKSNVEMRTNARVLKVNLDGPGQEGQKRDLYRRERTRIRAAR